jgi:hypothetical protein
MTRPWEETWERTERNDVEDEYQPVFCNPVLNDEPTEVFLGTGPRLQLAAAAPEMARLLLELEWAGEIVNYATGSSRMSLRTCAACGGVRPHPQAGSSGHHPDCRLGAVLRKAGVLP